MEAIPGKKKGSRFLCTFFGFRFGPRQKKKKIQKYAVASDPRTFFVRTWSLFSFFFDDSVDFSEVTFLPSRARVLLSSKKKKTKNLLRQIECDFVLVSKNISTRVSRLERNGVCNIIHASTHNIIIIHMTSTAAN